MQEKMGAKGGESETGQLSNKLYLKLPMTFSQEHPELSPQLFPSRSDYLLVPLTLPRYLFFFCGLP